MELLNWADSLTSLPESKLNTQQAARFPRQHSRLFVNIGGKRDIVERMGEHHLSIDCKWQLRWTGQNTTQAAEFARGFALSQ